MSHSSEKCQIDRQTDNGDFVGPFVGWESNNVKIPLNKYMEFYFHASNAQQQKLVCPIQQLCKSSKNNTKIF